MTAIVRITVPMPPSANEYWRSAPGRGLVPSKEATEYKAKVRTLLATTRPLVGDVVLSAVIYRARKAGDLGNRLKVLEDALIGIAYLDDGQIAEYRRVRRSDAQPERARVELELEGEAFASPKQVVDAAAAKQSASAKRRATVNRNRRAAARCLACGGSMLVPCPSTCPTRRRGR